MKFSMKNLSLGLVVGALAVATQASANSTVTVDPSATWIGYMNVLDLPQDGGAALWGSGWGTADLTATWGGSVLTLGTNNIGDPNEYWYKGGGRPGAQGNKIMDANMYVETTGVHSGTLTFSGLVLSNTLVGHTDSLGNGWTSVAFIKDFAPDYSSFNMVTADLVNGAFNLNMNLVADPNRHVQYGFETKGSCVWATDAALFGNVQVTAVPEPMSLVAVGTGLAMVIRRRRSSR